MPDQNKEKMIAYLKSVITYMNAEMRGAKNNSQPSRPKGFTNFKDNNSENILVQSYEATKIRFQEFKRQKQLAQVAWKQVQKRGIVMPSSSFNENSIELFAPATTNNEGERKPLLALGNGKNSNDSAPVYSHDSRGDPKYVYHPFGGILMMLLCNAYFDLLSDLGDKGVFITDDQEKKELKTAFSYLLRIMKACTINLAEKKRNDPNSITNLKVIGKALHHLKTLHNGRYKKAAHAWKRVFEHYLRYTLLMKKRFLFGPQSHIMSSITPYLSALNETFKSGRLKVKGREVNLEALQGAHTFDKFVDEYLDLSTQNVFNEGFLKLFKKNLDYYDDKADSACEIIFPLNAQKATVTIKYATDFNNDTEIQGLEDAYLCFFRVVTAAAMSKDAQGDYQYLPRTRIYLKALLDSAILGYGAFFKESKVTRAAWLTLEGILERNRVNQKQLAQKEKVGASSVRRAFYSCYGLFLKRKDHSDGQSAATTLKEHIEKCGDSSFYKVGSNAPFQP